MRLFPPFAAVGACLVATALWLASSVLHQAADRSSSPSRSATLAGTGLAGFSGDGGLAVRAQLNNPYGLTRGPDGALYVCDMDNHRIRRIARDGTISTVVGVGKRGATGDGGPATRAELNEPYEIRFDAGANMFFVEMKGQRVRRVDAGTGIISTVAGTGQAGFSGDGGSALAATLNNPHSIQFSPRGDLFICDIGNHRLRKVDMKSGIITSIAGTGERQPTPDGAPFATAPLHGPRALDFDRDGQLWLALREGNAIYRLDLEAGSIHHVAGTGKSGFAGNGGPARAATLSGPKGIAVGPDGHIYFADTESHSIRRVNRMRDTVELIAGTGQRGDGPDGDPVKCRFARPHGIFVEADGTVLIGDSENHRVRVLKMNPAGN